MLFSLFHDFVKLNLSILFSRLISFFPIFNRVMKNEKLKKVTYRSHTNSPPPTLIRTVVRCSVTREGEGGGYDGGWGYVGAAGGEGRLTWGTGQKSCFGNFLENYYVLVAPGRTWSFEFCRKLQKLESFFTKFNQVFWILCTKNNPFYWKQKWIIID